MIVNEICIICFDSLQRDRIEINCSHRFHDSCLRDYFWYCRSKNLPLCCPICRAPFTSFRSMDTIEEGITHVEEAEIAIIDVEDNRRIEIPPLPPRLFCCIVCDYIRILLAIGFVATIIVLVLLY